MKNKLLFLLLMSTKFILYGFVLQCVFLQLLVATDIVAQQSKSIREVKIEWEVNDAKIMDIFTLIEMNTGFKFSYDRKDLDRDMIINLSGRYQSIADVLLEISRQANLKFMQINETINVIKLPENGMFDSNKAIEVIIQTRNITGRITSKEDSEGLPGVNVVEKGTSNGTVTDVQGAYSLAVTEGATLVFSSVGYVTEEIAIGNKSEINLLMNPDIKTLQEIVVVGYGTVKKSDLTGAVSSVKSEQLTAYPAIGVVQALQGRAAGVQITANNGEPGSPYKIRIRGGTSINASSDPIFVVDGFVGAIMPPTEDIESIEVLKDASATAIYGSRGANGVIMVTTKRGKPGKTKIDFKSSYSVQNEINRLDLLNAEQFMDYIQEARPQVESMGANTDWQDVIFRTGSIQNYQLSVSGGNDFVNYYLSGAYFDQSGVILGSRYNRFSITSNVEMKTSERLKMGLNIFAQRNTLDGTRTQEGSGGTAYTGVVAAAFKFEPDQPIIGTNGRYTLARLNDPHDNPYAIATQLVNDSINDRIQGNLYTEYDIVKGLKFRVTLGATTNSGRTGLYYPTTLNNGRNVGGDATLTGSRSTSLQNENYFTYSKYFSEKHNITAMAGYSFQSHEEERSKSRGQNFISDAFSFYNLGASSVYMSPGSGISDWILKSYYGRLNYSFDSKYLFTFNARYDGSSTFSKNHKWAFFPSGSFAWNMGNEKFMTNLKLISQYKWRISYGFTGNQAISPYQTLARFSPVFMVVDGNPQNAIRPTSVANDNLTWETTAQLNIGMDIGLLYDRINISADIYRMITSDLLFSVPLPQYSGYGNMLKNIGELENKGFEVALAGKMLTGSIKWDSELNVSVNRNKILSLPDGNDIRYGSFPGHLTGLGDTQILREGYPVGSFYGWMYDGVYQEGDEFLPGGGFEKSAGGEKFRDIDGLRNAEGELTGQPDGILDANDRTIVGNPNPKFIWGWNNDVRWKNFDLNIFFQGSQGNDILSYTLLELELLSGINNATKNALNRWTPTNTNTNVPKAVTGRTRRVSSRFVYDGSFARLKNISLGYNLPTLAANKLNLTNLRLYVSAQNIFTLTNYEGYDPEVNYKSEGSEDGNRNLGLDYGSYPNAKSYTVGLNIVL